MARDTADRILDAAEELIAERGYAATSTRAIAERAGVNEVTLFRRFENKAGILRGLGERFAAKSAARAVSELPDPDDVLGTLRAIARQEIESSIESGGVALRLAFDARSVPEVAAMVGEGPRANLEALAGYFTDRQRAGAVREDIDAVVLAEAFSSLTSSFVMLRSMMGTRPEDTMQGTSVEQLVDLFWSGSRARGGGDG